MKKLILKTLFLLYFANGFAQTGNSFWNWSNPVPHGNDIIDVHQRTLAGYEATFQVGKHGLMMILPYLETHYQPMNSRTENDLVGITSIDENVLCAVSVYTVFPQYRSDIYRSTDNGQTWNSALANVTPIRTIESNDEVIIAAGDQGVIRKSTDAGLTFQTLTYQPTSVDFKSCATQGENYFIVGSDGSMHKTTDGGVSFTAIPVGGNPILNHIITTGINKMLVCGNNGNVRKSTNGGNNWFTIDPPTTKNLHSIENCADSVIYVVGDSGTVFRSTNGGSSWIQINVGATEDFVAIIRFNLCTEITIFGRNGIMVSSSDSGQNWYVSSRRVTDKSIKSVCEIAIPPSNNVMSAEKVLVCGDNGFIGKTTNGGEDWIALTSGTTLSLRASYFADENTGWVAGGTGSQNIILKTTNSGTNWFAQSPPVTDILNDMHFINSTTGVIVGNGGKVLRTTNAGTNWNTVSANTTSNINSVDFKDANTGVLVCTSGFMRRTTNGGANWSNIPLVTASGLYSVSFADENLCIIVGQTGIKLRSTNAGASFSIISNSQFNHMYSLFMVNSNTGYAVGFANDINNTGSMVITTNGGLNWTKFNSGTNDSLFGITFTGNGNGYAVGEGGTILKLDAGGILNLTAFIEGFYNSSTDTMVSDTAMVYLRNAAAPYVLVGSSKTIMNASGSGTLSFSNVSNGTNYYIVVKHRNSIETWSSGGNAFISNSLTYDFSVSSSNAFGNNLKLVDSSPIRFAIYSGDVNQDGNIDLTDLISVNNDASNFKTGYLNTDVNGNVTVDLTDLIIAYNNSLNFVSKVVP